MTGCAGGATAPDSDENLRAMLARGDAPPSEIELTNTLESRLAKSEPGDFLPVVVRLRTKAVMQSETSIQDAPDKDSRRDAAVAFLQEFSTDSQHDLVTGLEQLEAVGEVRNIEPIWLANVVCVEITANGLAVLSRYPDIDYVTSDTEAPLFLESTAWGVGHINSPDVWQRAAGSLTGKGVVVAVLDSGADLDHPDLQRRFWINSHEDLNGDGRSTRSDYNGLDDDGNGFVDDIVGWDFESDDSDPSPNLFESGRARGHGTHVAGIIAGDGSAGLATGVAPGASLMILKISSQRSAWAAMQYALANGADILNMSIGWPQSSAPDLGTWRDAVDNLTDAGVLVVTGSGSGGYSPMVHSPAPDDVTTPGRVPRALTVAAVAKPSTFAWLDPVASFNSAGPVSWQSVDGYGDYPFPPGLMKPDVTAPGVNITSTMIGGSYQAKSGTSMAVAHVSGLAALLLEDDPRLLPHDLVFLIRESAWRFADPNDVRGWGRIDALQAVDFRYESQLYDISVAKPDHRWRTGNIWIDNDGDGQIDDLVAGMNNRIYARIENAGGQSVGNAEIRFFAAPAGTISDQRIDADRTVHPDGSAYQYIGSYHVPVIGTAGSAQDAFIGAVEWYVPRNTTGPGQWSLAVEVVAPNPPNRPESNRRNNSTFRNDFAIPVAPGQKSTFSFYIYGDPQHPSESFDLEVRRYGLPGDFEIELSLDEARSDKWVERLRGFEPVKPEQLAEVPVDVIATMGKSIRMLSDRGQLERIALNDGKPLLARLTIRAPEIDSEFYSSRAVAEQYLLINTANDSGVFGGLSLKVSLNEDAAEVSKIIYARK